MREKFKKTQLAVDQTPFVLLWSVDASHRISSGKIVVSEKGNLNLTRPLDDPGLFLSFARLAAKGMPSENSILTWTNKRGLLYNRDYVTVDEFRREAETAHTLLKLYETVEKQDKVLARELLSGFGSYSNVNLTDYPDVLALHVASTAFESVLTEKLSGVRLSFAQHRAGTIFTRQNLEDAPELAERLRLTGLKDQTKIELGQSEPHPATLGNYRPEPSYDCPDLLSGIYLQLYRMTTDQSPLKNCANPPCGMPFKPTNTRNVYCCDSCRSNGRNYR